MLQQAPFALYLPDTSVDTQIKPSRRGRGITLFLIGGHFKYYGSPVCPPLHLYDLNAFIFLKG